MGRLKKFGDAQPVVDLPEPPQVDFTQAELESDSDDFGKIIYMHIYIHMYIIYVLDVIDCKKFQH